MPIDCPHDQCDFFLWNPNAPCPACGHVPVGIELRELAQNPWVLVAAGPALALVIALLVRVLGTTGTLAIIGACLAVTAIIVYRIQLQRAAAPTTIDAAYRAALERSTNQISRWSDVYGFAFNRDVLTPDEQQLLAEAEELAACSCTQAVQRCYELGAKYVNNSVERLQWLSLQNLDVYHGETRVGAWDRAVAISELYLGNLWIEARCIADAQDQIKQLHRDRYADSIVSAVARVSFFDEKPAGNTPGDLDAERRRLRIERELGPHDAF